MIGVEHCAWVALEGPVVLAQFPILKVVSTEQGWRGEFQMKIETVDGNLVRFEHLPRRELRESTCGVPVVLREGCGYALSSSDCDLLLTDSRRIARDRYRLEDALLWLCKNGDLSFVAIAL